MHKQLKIEARKHGFLEKYCTILNVEYQGSTAVSAVVHLPTVCDFRLFKQAWELLFQRQPMLRARCDTGKNDFLMYFDAQFADVPLAYFADGDDAVWRQEYTRDSLKPFDLNLYSWRSSLVNMEDNADGSYIIFAAPHSICDARSISWLLGDLLRIMQGLEHDKLVETASFTEVLPLDAVLDKSKFTLPQETADDLSEPWEFQAPVSGQDSCLENILKVIPGEVLSNILQTARQRSTTVTSAVFVAYGMACCEMADKDALEMPIAIDFRPYTSPLVAKSKLAFYAHMMPVLFKRDDGKNFWEMAQQAKEDITSVVHSYQLPSSADSVFAELFANKKKSFAQQQFICGPVLSNAGRVDEAFQDLSAKFDPDIFYFTFSNAASLFGPVLFLATLKDQLFFDFSFTSPSLSYSWMEKVAERTCQLLLQHQSG